MRPRNRKWFVRLLLPIGLAAGVAVLFTGPGSSSHALARSFGISLVYSVCIGGVAYFPLSRLGPRLGRIGAPWNWALFLAACGVVSAVGCALSVGVLTALRVYPANAYWPALNGAVRIALVIGLALGVSTFLCEMLRFRLERATLEEQRARLASLESRVHPHFLFNTLNSISALIREDPHKAERTVEQLAALLRYSLDSNTGGLAPLRQEMHIVADYLEIERTRFGDRLRYAIDMPEALADAEVPPMAVQTIVENSVKYAISPRRAGGEIRIVARAAGDRLQVEIADDGPGFTAADMKQGHGLDNLRARLASQFAAAAALEVAPGARGAIVTVSVPLKRVLV